MFRILRNDVVIVLPSNSIGLVTAVDYSKKDNNILLKLMDSSHKSLQQIWKNKYKIKIPDKFPICTVRFLNNKDYLYPIHLYPIHVKCLKKIEIDIRLCYLCEYVLKFNEYIQSNKHFSLNQLINLWKNKYIKIICCDCKKIVEDLLTIHDINMRKKYLIKLSRNQSHIDKNLYKKLKMFDIL